MAKTDACDPHRDIPKDANGDPIFLVLPAGTRATFERYITRCEAGWRASHDPAFISEAITWTHLHRQPPALWLSEAVIELAAKRRTKGYATRVYNAAIKQMRFEAVREARRVGTKGRLNWLDAYREASEALADTQAAGKASTMKRAYEDVMRDRKNGRGARYLAPHMPRRKLGDVARREPST